MTTIDFSRSFFAGWTTVCPQSNRQNDYRAKIRYLFWPICAHAAAPYYPRTSMAVCCFRSRSRRSNADVPFPNSRYLMIVKSGKVYPIIAPNVAIHPNPSPYNSQIKTKPGRLSA